MKKIISLIFSIGFVVVNLVGCVSIPNSETERQRYDTVKGDPLCSGLNDNIEFTQELSAEKSVRINGTERALSYYFSSINLKTCDTWVNPDSVDIRNLRDVYTDSDHNIYVFDSDHGTFEIYKSNSYFDSDESDNEGNLTNEQAVNIVVDFVKDLTTEDVYQNPEVTLRESGLFIVRFENSDEYFKESSLTAHISRSGVVKHINIAIHQNDSVTVDQIEATDEKLEAYINEYYKNFTSFTYNRMVDIVKGTPVIFYSVIFTETYGTNKANYVEQIVLKIDD